MKRLGADVDPLRRAYIELMMARAIWRAAKDAEDQVAHWLACGEATVADLLEARERTKMTRTAHQRATRKYEKLRQAPPFTAKSPGLGKPA